MQQEAFVWQKHMSVGGVVGMCMDRTVLCTCVKLQRSCSLTSYCFRSAELAFVRTTPQWEFSQLAVREAQMFNVSYLAAEPCSLFARKFATDSAEEVTCHSPLTY